MIAVKESLRPEYLIAGVPDKDAIDALRGLGYAISAAEEASILSGLAVLVHAATPFDPPRSLSLRSMKVPQ